MRIDLPRPHSPLLPCLNPRKLEVSGREMGSSFSYCGYMFEIHVGTFLKNFEFFGQPRTSLRSKGSLAGVRFGHVPPNRSAEIREPDPLVSPRSWQLTNSPLTSINIGIISHDMFIKAFGSLTVPVSIPLPLETTARWECDCQSHHQCAVKFVVQNKMQATVSRWIVVEPVT